MFRVVFSFDEGGVSKMCWVVWEKAAGNILFFAA